MVLQLEIGHGEQIDTSPRKIVQYTCRKACNIHDYTLLGSGLAVLGKAETGCTLIFSAAFHLHTPKFHYLLKPRGDGRSPCNLASRCQRGVSYHISKDFGLRGILLKLFENS